jgi:Tfp pilus assembly protein FimV
MAAFFGLWLLTIKNRTKTIEVDAPEGATPKVSSGPLKEGAYSLAPSKEQSIERSTNSNAPGVEPAYCKGTSPLNADQEGIEDGGIASADDPIAKTHLEIANQFFSMGDFEGATEMCQLVLDNEGASSDQKSSAEQLMMECA